MGCVDSEITDNTFKDNESASILGVAYFLIDSKFDPSKDAEFTFYNEDIHIHDNTYSKGGGIYNRAGVLDRPGGPFLEGVYALNGGERPHIIVDDQDYRAAGLPVAGAQPIISESTQPTLVSASFVGASQGQISIKSRDIGSFGGDGYIFKNFEINLPEKTCN